MKKPISSHIDTATDLRVGIFRILAAGGFIVSAITGTINLVVGLPIQNALVCWATAILSLALMLYAKRTGKYSFCVTVTIIMIFLGVFTLLFIDGGGYKSGMPLYFVMAVVFTAFMLEGPQMYVIAVIEILWYIALFVFAYLHPEAIHMIESEAGLLTDVLIALPVVSVVIAVTMYLQLQLILKKQDELERARKDALSASDAKTEFLANMSHDIRTPLNTVMSYNDLIAGRTASDEIKSWTDDIRIACNILLSLINDILDLSRIESGRIKLQEAPYLTVQLLKETETAWRGASERAGLSFRLEADEALPSVMSGNLDSIRKIVNNLVGNAIKYTDKGEVCVRFFAGTDTETADADRAIFCIEVGDTGIGIAPGDIERVFLPFERGSTGSKRGAEGTGLGLAIVKDLTEAMRGTVSCESIQGEGSRFTVCIPQVIQDIAPIGPRESWIHISSEAETFDSIIAPDAKILVVDDNEYNRQVMSSLLKPTLILLDDVESGREALEMLEIRDYDLILMDIMMPEMDGPETLRKIRELHLADDTPVVALTADALAGTRERLLNEGFSEYLAKPVSMKQLGELLIRYLGDRVRLIRDTSSGALPQDHIAGLKEMLLPMHIHLEDTLELDGDSAENLLMRAEYFLNYRDELKRITEESGINKAEGAKDKISEDAFREELFHFVHSLKSAARSIGARDLTELAAFMERHRDDVNLNRLMLPVLREEFRTVSEGEELLVRELGGRNEAENEK